VIAQFQDTIRTCRLLLSASALWLCEQGGIGQVQHRRVAPRASLICSRVATLAQSTRKPETLGLSKGVAIDRVESCEALRLLCASVVVQSFDEIKPATPGDRQAASSGRARFVISGSPRSARSTSREKAARFA